MYKLNRVVLSAIGLAVVSFGANLTFAQDIQNEAQLEDVHVYEGSSSTCAAAMQNVDQITDIDLLNDCMEYYWHNGDEENPPGSYNNQIKLGKRWVQLDPQATQTYTVVAWLLWSKYATWTRDPNLMPDGATKAQEAIDLLLVGRAANPTDPDYHLDCGDTIQPLAKFHAPQYYPFVEDSYKLADRYFTDPARKVRARLNLGHTYRFENKKAEAIAAYKSVLEIDPNNAVALRYLKEL